MLNLCFPRWRSKIFTSLHFDSPYFVIFSLRQRKKKWFFSFVIFLFCYTFVYETINIMYSPYNVCILHPPSSISIHFFCCSIHLLRRRNIMWFFVYVRNIKEFRKIKFGITSCLQKMKTCQYEWLLYGFEWYRRILFGHGKKIIFLL